MAGLLSDDWDDPQNQGLLALGLGLLGSRGSFAQGLSQAGQQAIGVYGAGRQRQRANIREDARDTQAQAAFQLQQQMAQIQMQQAQAQQAEQQQVQAAIARNRLSPVQQVLGANGGAGPTPGAAQALTSTPAGFNRQGFADDLAGIDPMKSLAYEHAMKKEAPELKEVQLMRDPASGKMVNVMLFKDGSTKVAPYGARPDIALQGLGDRMVSIDKNETPAGNIWQMGASPDARMQSRTALTTAGMADRRAGERLDWDKTQVGKPAFHDGAWMTPPTQQNPAGTVVRVPGIEKPLNEVQGNATGFGIKAQNALDNLSSLEKVTGKDNTLRAMPYGSAEWAMSTNGKLAINAERQFIAAVLRKESGAVISDGEYATYGNQYFPRLMDPPELLAQKAQNRQSAILVMQAQAGAEGVRKIDQAVGKLRNGPPPAAPGGAGGEWSITPVGR